MSRRTLTAAVLSAEIAARLTVLGAPVSAAWARASRGRLAWAQLAVEIRGRTIPAGDLFAWGCVRRAVEALSRGDSHAATIALGLDVAPAQVERPRGELVREYDRDALAAAERAEAA